MPGASQVSCCTRPNGHGAQQTEGLVFHFSTCELFGWSLTDDSRAVLAVGTFTASTRGDHNIGPREGNPHERIFTRYGKRTGFHFSTCELFGRSFTDDSRAVLPLLHVSGSPDRCLACVFICVYIFASSLICSLLMDGRTAGPIQISYGSWSAHVAPGGRL